VRFQDSERTGIWDKQGADDSQGHYRFIHVRLDKALGRQEQDLEILRQAISNAGCLTMKTVELFLTL
jgi:hypothetical protein